MADLVQELMNIAKVHDGVAGMSTLAATIREAATEIGVLKVLVTSQDSERRNWQEWIRDTDADLAASQDNVVAMVKELQALRKRCEAVEADAARYRWLRKVTPYRLKKLQNESIADASDVLYFLQDRFDAAIDAAIAAAQEPSHG